MVDVLSSESRTELVQPSHSYRFRAWLAMLGLLFFVAIYIGLASWFTYTTYRMVAGVAAGGDGAFPSFFTAVASGFLAIFMWKALFFIHRGMDDPGIEITEAEQPRFFAFLYELADEIGAPRPHRVFVSPDVNASVFYDLTILNFLMPSKKNLLIGLGLVNVLTKSELRAVLAHEFGHFAQRTMAVGRWVYMGEQIASHMIGHRGRLDALLDGISGIDLRIAWIGWLMRLIVWSIRSLMEAIFRVVIIAYRALSREMEFNADLVAVSVTGSDALVNGLYRLQPADDDWQQSIHFCAQQFDKKRSVKDIFAVHSRIGKHMERILGEMAHREPPSVPAANAAEHRIFSPKLATPPKMWMTHPPNTEREENAKRTYVGMSLDETPAWSVFDESQKLRDTVTAHIFKDVKLDEPPTPLSVAETNDLVDAEYTRESWEPEYQGVYVGRDVTLKSGTAEELLPKEQLPRERIAETLKSLFPPRLREDMVSVRNLNEEVGLLEAVESGHYQAAGGDAQHRGQIVTQGNVGKLIDAVKAERDEVLNRINENDRSSRAAHHAAARYVAFGWQEYLTSALKLLHYAEHSEADLQDAFDQLMNITSYATAAGPISGSKLRKVMHAANDLHLTMDRLDRQADAIKPPQRVLDGLSASSWREALEKYELPVPDDHNIGQWMDVIGGWAESILGRFGQLRDLMLDEVLLTEKRVRRMYFEEEERVQAPKPLSAPDSYMTRMIGSERERQKKLDWWSRFTLADGWVPATLRLSVAGAIVGVVLYFGAVVGKGSVVIYNGLATPVRVSINGKTKSVYPFAHTKMLVGGSNSVVQAHTDDGQLIEEFDVATDRGFAQYVYNVASAAPLVEWTVSYGRASNVPPRPKGCERWRTTAVSYLFTEPPRSIETSSSGETRTALNHYPNFTPQQLLSVIVNEQEQQHAIRMHFAWDDSTSPYFPVWASLASEQTDFRDVLKRRLEQSPFDLHLLRLEQDNALDEEREEVLQRHRDLAAKYPDNPDLHYIGVRAMPDSPEQDRAFIEGFEKRGTNWFAWAAASVHANYGRWGNALKAYEQILSAGGALAEQATIRMARIRRLQNGENVDLQELRPSAGLDSVLQLESGDQLEGLPVYAYYYLNQGALAQAYQHVKDTSDEFPHSMLALLAASENAKPEWQAEAFAIDPTAIEEEQFQLFMAALAVRLKRPYEGYLSHFEKLTTKNGRRKSTTPMKFLRTLIDEGPKPSLEKQLDGLSIENRGFALAAAVVMYPKEAPRAWRRDARRLLFAFERPYFSSR